MMNKEIREFIYWLNETNNNRGLKNNGVDQFRQTLEELFKEFKTKYPNGLTGFTRNVDI